MIGIYCRISKRKEEGRDVSIAVQKDAGIKFATQQKIPHKLFIDEGISGAKGEIADRPMFAELFKAIEDKKISMVYCYDQSRIERNSNIWSLFVGVMLKNDCKYYPEGKFFDLDDPTNRFFSGILSLSNELYSSLTSKKVKDAIYKNVRQGKAHGLTAYGYTKNSSGYFELNPKEAKVVEKIYDLSLQGIGAYRIAAILNSEGIATKFNTFKGVIKRKDEYTGKISEHKKEEVKWRGNVVHDIIRNSIYKGERVWKEEIITVPAIVSKETWERVNRNLKANKKNAGKRAEYHYLLNGILVCGNCGSEMRGKKRLKGNDNAYKCKRKAATPRLCTESRGISIPKLDTVILKILIRITEMRHIIRTLKPKSAKENSVWESKLIKLQSEADIENKKIKRILKLLVDEDLNDFSELKIQLSTAQKRKADLISNIEEIEKQIQRTSQLKDKPKWIPGKSKGLDDLDFDEIKSTIHSIVESIEVKHQKLTKGGAFHVQIKLLNYSKPIAITTNWEAQKWRYTRQILSEPRTIELNDFEIIQFD